jgi:hypothetical protein
MHVLLRYIYNPNEGFYAADEKSREVTTKVATQIQSKLTISKRK